MVQLSDSPVIDVRQSLPRADGEGFPSRRLADIHGVVVHHTAGEVSIETEAQGHIDHRGWPGLAYHLWVEFSGDVLWANDLRSATYSQGGASSSSPVPYTRPNENFAAVVLRGDLSRKQPTNEQSVALSWLWTTLRTQLNLKPDMLLCHGDFKATLCPGNARQAVNSILCDVPQTRGLMPVDAAGFQRALTSLGHDPGPVDGVAGPRTRGALSTATGSVSIGFDSAYAVAQLLKAKASQGLST